jgi:hypothetical protein
MGELKLESLHLERSISVIMNLHAPVDKIGNGDQNKTVLVGREK